MGRINVLIITQQPISQGNIPRSTKAPNNFSNKSGNKLGETEVKIAKIFLKQERISESFQSLLHIQ